MDKYSKVKVLGKGSFGSATLIRRKSDGQLLVVKEVNMSRMSKKEKEEARHECRVLQRLKHPNITQFVEQFEKNQVLYIVMEYADGGDLHQKIEAAKRTRGAIKEELALHYFAQLCLALEYLHSEHILHRDIKAMNVFLTSSGVVKLGDFGISTVLRNTLGMANTVCGTPYYFSPELCQNKPYNNKSDVWALGIILYELLTLNHAFDGDSMRQLLNRIVKSKYTPISPSVSGPVRDIVDMCLRKDPARRPTMKQILGLEAMRHALGKLQGDLSSAAMANKPLKEVVASDPLVEDEAERVRKAKVAGQRAAQAVGIAPAQQTPPPAVPKPLADAPKPAALPAVRATPVDVKRAMGNIDQFIAQLGRPTQEAARDAARRAELERQAKEERAEREHQERLRREKERQRAAELRVREQQAELERMLNIHKERLRVNQEREKERRDEIKRVAAAKDKRREKEKGPKKPGPAHIHLAANAYPYPAPANKVAQPKAPSRPRSPEVERQAPYRRRSPIVEALVVAAPEVAPSKQQQQQQQLQQQAQQVQKVQNWVNRENEKKREAQQRKKEEERIAVLEMDQQVRKAQQRDGRSEMHHKVLDPQLEAWVQQEIERDRQALPHRVESAISIDRNVDAAERILRQQGSKAHPIGRNVKAEAVNAFPLFAKAEPPSKAERPAGREGLARLLPDEVPASVADRKRLNASKSDPSLAAPGFPPLPPSRRMLSDGGMQRAYSHDATPPEPVSDSSAGQPESGLPTPFKPNPKLFRSPGQKQQKHQRSYSDVTMEYDHSDLAKAALARPSVEHRGRMRSVQRLELHPDDLAIRRDVSAPPVLRTPTKATKHLDASTPLGELDSTSNMVDVPTPVREWIDPTWEARKKLQLPGERNVGSTGSGEPNSAGTGSAPSTAGHGLSPIKSAASKAPTPPQLEPEISEELIDGSFADDVSEDGLAVAESIDEAAASPHAVSLRNQQYDLMRSHIATLLGTPKRSGSLDDEVMEEIAEGDAEENSETSDEFGDAEPLTTGPFDAEVAEEADEEVPESLSDRDSTGGEAQPNVAVKDFSDTALHRVAAMCGEHFSGSQPCHLDGRPLFDPSAGHLSLAESLRAHLEEALGMVTLSGAYGVVNELLVPPPQPPSSARGSSGRSDSSRSSEVSAAQRSVLRRVTEIIVDGMEGGVTAAEVEELVTLVAQLVFFDAEAFGATH